MAHLLKMFQELSHYNNELSRGNEKEILLILDYCELLRQKSHTFQNENFGLQNILRTYDGDRDKSRQDVKELKCQLVEARSQIAALVSTKQSLEHDKLNLEDQIDFVRELLKDIDYLPEQSRKKLEFLKERPFSSRNHIHPSSASIVSECEIDYDKTDDSIENETSLLRGGKKWVRQSSTNGGNNRKRSRSVPRSIRPSAPPIEEEVEPTPKKRSKDDLEIKSHFKGELSKGGGNAIVATATFTIPMNGGGTTNAQATAEIKRASLNKSISEPHLLSPQAMYQFGGRQYLTASTTNLSPYNNYSSSSNLLNRRHTFLTKTILKPEYCDACNKRIAFGKNILRCQECKVQCHPECRDQAQLPCVPRGTPTNKNQKGKLVDFVPPNPPMIPHILVHCINEIERRGVDWIGLYRVSGTESKVNDLLEKFLWGKGVPNLRLVEDTNVLASCVKKFLGQLKEPLIPATSWHEFVRAAETVDGAVDMNALHQAIADLPLPNKDTLAFLILHLQRVADAKDANSMTVSNLAKVFGPTVVGYSTETFKIDQGIAESPKQESVISSLMSLPSDYWTRLVNNSEVGPILLNPITPEIRGSNYKQLRFDSATKLYPTLPLPSPMGADPTLTLLGPQTPGLYTGTPKSGTIKTRSQKRFFQPPWK